MPIKNKSKLEDKKFVIHSSIETTKVENIISDDTRIEQSTIIQINPSEIIQTGLIKHVSKSKNKKNILIFSIAGFIFLRLLFC